MTNTTISKLDAMIRAYYAWMETINDIENELGVTIETKNVIYRNNCTEEKLNELAKRMINAEKDAGRGSRKD